VIADAAAAVVVVVVVVVAVVWASGMKPQMGSEQYEAVLEAQWPHQCHCSHPSAHDSTLHQQ
jgi:hypothetical protein